MPTQAAPICLLTRADGTVFEVVPTEVPECMEPQIGKLKRIRPRPTKSCPARDAKPILDTDGVEVGQKTAAVLGAIPQSRLAGLLREQELRRAKREAKSKR